MITKEKRKRKQLIDRYKRVVGFWSLLLFSIIIVSFLVKTTKEIRKSVFFKLGRISLVVLNTNSDSSSIFSLGEKEGVVFNIDTNQSDDYKILQLSVKEKYLIPISGYIFLGQNIQKLNAKNSQGQLQKILLNSFLKKTKTNLNKYDLALIFYKSLCLKDKIMFFNNKDEIPQGSLIDEKLKREAFSVSVFNATDKMGLAQETSQFLEYNGIRVVQIADNQSEKENCEILFSAEKENTYTAFWLKSVYDCQVVKIDGGDGRTDFTLILSPID